jgi:hypothetical protein
MTAITPTDIVPCHHQYCLLTMAYFLLPREHHLLTNPYRLPMMGYHLLPMGYLYLFHPFIRARCFHCKRQQPRERIRTMLGVALMGI